MNSTIVNDPKLRKLLSDDTVLQHISRRFISLQSEEVKTNNEHLLNAIDAIIDRMAMVNSLFKKLYQRKFFGGSFYKGTKISEPREFDLNIIIKLPYNPGFILLRKGPPGFVQLFLQSNQCNLSKFTAQEIRELSKIVTAGFLNQERFRAWIEGIITKAIEQLPKENRQYILRLSSNEGYKIQIKKSGPAFTFVLRVDNEVTIDVDLVPVLEFNKELPFTFTQHRMSQSTPKTWLAVPKPLITNQNGENNNRYWRLSFYDQEKNILSKYGRTKPLIRLMKKMRDTQQWYGLASYYLENLFLHEIETLGETLNKEPLTLLFFKMLCKLMVACSKHSIPLYWDMNCNLLAKMHVEETRGIANRLRNIIGTVERNIENDKFIMAKYILNPTEHEILVSQAITVHNTETSTVNNEEWNCRLF